MRLIDADALKKCLEKERSYGGVKTDEFDKGYDLGVETSIEMLDNAPTVARTERNFVMIEGKPIYITQGYIDAMIEYERKEQVKEVVERLMNL